MFNTNDMAKASNVKIALTPYQVEALVDLIDKETILFAKEAAICPSRIVALRSLSSALKG